MISIGLLIFLTRLNKPMCGFLFDARNEMYKLLSYIKIHMIFINLRNILFLLFVLAFGADLPHMKIFAMLVDLMMAISIFFAYVQLAYGFSIKDCAVYLKFGKIDKEWLKEIQK